MTNSAEITRNRRIAFGPEDDLMNMAAVKYKWAEQIYERMEDNTWFPRSVQLGADKVQYRERLSANQRSSYDKALAFLSNLDGFQFNNLINNIGLHITDPMIKLCIARQASEEGVHVRSYQTLVEAVSANPEDIYMMFERDGMLAKKNAYIKESSMVLKDDPTPRNFALAVVNNVLLEGLYFYTGFLNFYILARSGVMLGSADMIKYINRDEGETHLDLFSSIFKGFLDENPGIWNDQFVEDAMRIVRGATELESAWGQYIVGEGYEGATKQLMDQYAKHRANVCCEKLNLPKPYPEIEDPAPWVEQFSRVGKNNFFERKETNYVASGLDWD